MTMYRRVVDDSTRLSVPGRLLEAELGNGTWD
jgi:hypothetical protein